MASTRATALKAPPYSVASEKIVLGSILRQPPLLHQVLEVLPASSAFFRPEHGRLYSLLIEAIRQDVASASAQLIERLSPKVSESALADLTAAGQAEIVALQHARIVADKARMRELIDLLTDILHDAYHSDDGADAVIDRACDRLGSLRSAGGARS